MKKLIALIIIPLIFVGCKSTPKVQTIQTATQTNSSEILKKIEVLNSKTPRSYVAEFTADVVTQKKSFKASGVSIYNQNPQKLRITLQDLVFKSPIVILVKDESLLKLYFPVENSVYVDDTSKQTSAGDNTLYFDYNFIAELSAGQIPLIENYKISNTVTNNADGVNHNFLILENDYFYQTISIKNDVPDKIMLVNKNNKDKIEIYLEDAYLTEDTTFYKSIRVLKPATGERLSIKYKVVKFNTTVDLKEISTLKIPAGTKEIPLK